MFAKQKNCVSKEVYIFRCKLHPKMMKMSINRLVKKLPFSKITVSHAEFVKRKLKFGSISRDLLVTFKALQAILQFDLSALI